MKPRQLLYFFLVFSVCSVAVLLWHTRPVSEPASEESTDSSDSEESFSAQPVIFNSIPATSNVATASVVAKTPSVVNYPTEELLEKIRAGLGSTNDADRDEVFTNLLPALVRQDAEAAAQLAESLDPGPLREQALRTVAQIWAAQDVAGALAWAAQLADGTERNSTLGDVLLQLGQSDPGKALTLVGPYGLADETGDLRGNLAQLWAQKDWLAALAWVQANPAAGLQQDQILERLAYVLAKTSPLEAANFVVGSISPGFTQTEAAIAVVHQWGLQDMAGARAWVEQFPDGELRQRGEQELNGIAAYQNAIHQNL
jgi:hypothetical protein